MPFPWGQPVLVPTFTCPHCGDVQTVVRETVPACSCSGSQQQAMEDRERAVAYNRAQEAARTARIIEANRRRRRQVDGG